MDLNRHIDNITQDILKELGNSVETVKDQIQKQIVADVGRRVASLDFPDMVRKAVVDLIKNKVDGFEFPDGSIPGGAVDLESFKISGNNIEGGVIHKFGSTGIQDNASDCQLTILDEATIVENKFITAEADIKGDLTVEGQLNLMGELNPDAPFVEDLIAMSAGRVALQLNNTFFEKYSDLVFNLITQNGLDLSKLTFGGKTVIEGNTLGTFITESNIQKVGELKQLTVRGETLLYNTLYVGNQRVGVNTTSPSSALSVWDEEVEIVAKKQQKDVAYIGTIRNNALVLGSNGNPNLTLGVDGSASVSKLHIGAVELTSAAAQPTHNAKRGVIVFNENVDVDKPLGWVSLGGARWAKISLN